MSTATVNSIWLQVDTSIISYIVNKFTIKFYVQSNSTETYTWGFHDMVILQRSCETCVSQLVQDLIVGTSGGIIVTLILVIVMMFILFGAVKFE